MINEVIGLFTNIKLFTLSRKVWKVFILSWIICLNRWFILISCSTFPRARCSNWRKERQNIIRTFSDNKTHISWWQDAITISSSMTPWQCDTKQICHHDNYTNHKLDTTDYYKHKDSQQENNTIHNYLIISVWIKSVNW